MPCLSTTGLHGKKEGRTGTLVHFEDGRPDPAPAGRGCGSQLYRDPWAQFPNKGRHCSSRRRGQGLDHNEPGEVKKTTTTMLPDLREERSVRVVTVDGRDTDYIGIRERF